jgi:hypothetical protein
MGRLIIVMALVLCSSGCALFETGAKATFDIAWKAAESVVKSRIPGLKQDLLDGAKGMADNAYEAAVKFTAQKTVDVTQGMIDKALAETGVNVVGFDSDQDDRITPAEFWEGWKRENERRGEKGEPPLGVTGTFWLLLATVGFTGGKSALRVLKKYNGNGGGNTS